ncbi:hypothetical protein SVAN01_05049 [Stagonosporopsis vannaccii]|nr:hypothetical protein SVAN01_05049 [Stagonosporopsis vannaccii]
MSNTSLTARPVRASSSFPRLRTPRFDSHAQDVRLGLPSCDVGTSSISRIFPPDVGRWWAIVGCGRAADQPRTGGPCKPQIAPDSYSIQTRNARRPGRRFDDACVLPTQRFPNVALDEHKTHQNKAKVDAKAGLVVRAGVGIEKRIRARGAVMGHFGHGQRSVPRGLEGGFIYPPSPRLADQSTSSLWLRRSRATQR